MTYFDLPSAAMAATYRSLNPVPANPAPDAELEQLLVRMRAAVACIEAQAKLFADSLPQQWAPGLSVDEHSREAFFDGADLGLTHMEFELLSFLQRNAMRSVTRGQLLSEVWGYDYDGGVRTIDVHVARLRKKLGEAGKQLETIRGFGYRWRPGVPISAVA
jgi:DNA-binding response OmpR family regulator